jgi:hypothetical protein
MRRPVGSQYEVASSPAANQPDGQIGKNLSSPSHKNIPLSPTGLGKNSDFSRVDVRFCL